MTTIHRVTNRLHYLNSSIEVVQRLPAGGSLWTPAQPTTSGGVSPHTWEVPGVSNFQDAAKTTPAGVGDVVGAVVNQGSDTHDVSQATTANKPTLQQVTIGSVTSYVWRFDGNNDYLQGAFGGGAISQPYTMFAVAALNAAAVNDGLSRQITDGDDATKRAILFKYHVPNPDVWAIFAGSTVVNAGSADNNWNVWATVFNGASSEAWLNGISKATGNPGSAGIDGLTLGSQYIPGQHWRGDIGPVLIYPGNLSTADKNEIGEYLEQATGIAWTTIV